MMVDSPEGATPLDPDAAEGLLPTHMTTREELNEWEQRNILEADRWVFSRRRPAVLSLPFIKQLHRKMFDQTWEWA
ncbi:MAG: mobile mystery protein B, partial [Gemmatimonadales bacterium]